VAEEHMGPGTELAAELEGNKGPVAGQEGSKEPAAGSTVGRQDKKGKEGSCNKGRGCNRKGSEQGSVLDLGILLLLLRGDAFHCLGLRCPLRDPSPQFLQPRRKQLNQPLEQTQQQQTYQALLEQSWRTFLRCRKIIYRNMIIHIAWKLFLKPSVSTCN